MAKQQKPPVTFGKRAFLAVLAGLFLAAAVCLRVFSDPFPRLEAAGFRITEEEYLRAMYQARNEVLSDHAAANHSLTDWSAPTPLGDPRQLTVDRTLELLREYYAVATLAVERGYLADAGYEAMKADLAQINRQRQEALDAGAVVTGLSSFTTDDYLTYRASSLRLQFCNDPANPENQVSPEALQQRYEADRDDLYHQPDGLELAFVEIESGTGEQEQALTALRQRALEMGDLAAALEEAPQLKAYYQEISVQPGTYSIYARSHGDVLSCADALRAGELSQIFRQDGWLCLIQCRQRTDRQYAPLEDVESIVAQSIRESRYDALIAERMESMALSGDWKALYRFTAEHLP